jgi:hypothetical protein
MVGRKLSASLVALGLVAIPAPAQAFCHLFNRCAKPVTTFYAPAPVVAAPVVAPQTVVNYMPQTAYRSVVVNRPVTTMVAQPGCDACGRPTTVMRPVTTFVPQQQLVPYTTYRPVVTTVATPVTVNYAPAPVVAAAPAPACCGATPTPTLSNYAPAPVAAPATAPAASCCGATPTPSLSNYAPSPEPSTFLPPASSSPTTTFSATPSYSSTPAPGTPGSTVHSLQPYPDPSLNPPSSQSTTQSTTPGSSSTPQTFAPNDNNTQSNGLNGNGSGSSTSDPPASPQSRMLLPPLNSTPNGSTSSLRETPRGLDPETTDRTTAIPLRRGFEVRQASLVVPAAEPKKAAADDGWRAVSE